MKNLLLESFDSIHEEMKSITESGSCGEYTGEAEYEDTKNIVDSILKSEIVKNLLHLFWQRTSDACPLECSDHELELKKWDKWISELDFDSLIKQSEKQELKFNGLQSDKNSFKEACEPLMKWLSEKHHPHTMVEVESNRAVLWEGKQTHLIE